MPEPKRSSEETGETDAVVERRADERREADPRVPDAAARVTHGQQLAERHRQVAADRAEQRQRDARSRQRIERRADVAETDVAQLDVDDAQGDQKDDRNGDRPDFSKHVGGLQPTRGG